MKQAASLPREAKLSGLRQFDRITKRCSRNLNLVFNVLLWIHRYKHQLKSKRLVLVLLKLKSRRLHPNLVFKSERETFTSLGSCSIWVKNETHRKMWEIPLSFYLNFLYRLISTSAYLINDL